VIDIVHDLIAWKRDGNELDAARMHEFVTGVADGRIAAYQASALLMAMVLRGLSEAETVALAAELVGSGRRFDLSAVGRPILDKHSSGGVGDKLTLIVGPLVAAAGGCFGKMSGRGLGHTGGTLDKLESIPGFRVTLSHGELIRQLERIGLAVVGLSPRVVPAEHTLYSLRDVTGTINEPGLIAASIMSKKIASGSSAVVLDLKVGAGAFMRDLDEVERLAGLCRAIGAAAGLPVAAVMTAMEQPLGSAVGNRLEVEEAWAVLTGQGPADVRELSLLLAAEVLALDAGSTEAGDTGAARALVEAALDSGRAAEQFDRWVHVQGGRWRPGEFQRLARAEVLAAQTGYVVRCDALYVGRAAQLTGAGRQRAEDDVEPTAGALLAKKVGDPVEAGEPLGCVLARDAVRRESARAVLAKAFEVAPAPPPAAALVFDRRGPA